MSPFDGENIVVIDLETAFSADDCRHCGDQRACNVTSQLQCMGDPTNRFTPIGWDDKANLGLSIGGYYRYRSDRVFWFNEANLEQTVSILIEEQPLMVSFNGVNFDYPIIEEVLRQRAQSDVSPDIVDKYYLHGLADSFMPLAANSYDIFAEIRASGQAKSGQTTLGALCEANGLGSKLSHGAQAPRDWQDGKHADVINYCSDDIYKTKALFELISSNGGWTIAVRLKRCGWNST